MRICTKGMSAWKTVGLPLGASLISAMSIAQTRPSTPAEADTSVIAADGTAHVTRIVPVPTTISPQAQKMLARPASDAAVPESLAERRRKTDIWQTGAGEAFRKLYPVNVASQTIGGVPTRVITPLSIPDSKRDRVLINVHGGGFNSDSGSFTESIPIASMTQTKVIAVLYRLAPEHPFPAAVDDTIAVYRELLKTYKPERIGLYGTSAGAILTAEVAVRLHQLGLPLPAALGSFPAWAILVNPAIQWHCMHSTGFRVTLILRPLQPRHTANMLEIST